jgi:glutamate/aspartate transport system substrate-binding protein
MRDVLLAIFMVGLIVSPVSAEQLTGTLQQIQKTGKIKIGYRTSIPPMSFINTKDTPEGYSIDLCQRIVAGVEKKIGSDILIEYVPVTADQRFDALAENKIDIMCGVTTNTLSRRELVDFTQITFLTGASYLTLKGSKIRNNFDGKKIGVVKGTTTATGLKELFREAEVTAEIVQFNTTAEGFNALKKRTIAAFSADQVVLIGLALSADDPRKYTILPDMFSFEPIALAVRRNDADFRLVADRELSRLFRSKEILTIYDRWLGEFAENMPPAFNALIKFNSISE